VPRPDLVTLYVVGVLLVPLTVVAAQYERDAMTDGTRAAVVFAVVRGGC